MSHIRHKLILGTVGLALVGLNLHWGAGQAMAESHGKSDSGETPYQVTTNIIPSTCTFNSVLYFCDVKFPAVPAGKHLVVDHVSLFVALNAGSPDSLRFRNSSNGTAFWVQPVFTTRAIANTHFFLDRPVEVFYASGDTPDLLLAASGPVSSTEITVHGYLVDNDN